MTGPRIRALIPLALALLGGCATVTTTPPGTGESPTPGLREFYVPEVDEALYGTWENLEYAPPGPPGKLVIFPWGLVQWFADVADGDFSEIGTSIIVDRWRDDTGATWFRECRRIRSGEGADAPRLVLSRVSSDEQVLESISGTASWPEAGELDPRNPTYVVYRRGH